MTARVDPETGERVRRVCQRVREAAAGIHRLGEPAVALDSELPLAVAAVYRLIGDASLFFDSLVLIAPGSIRLQDGRWCVGEVSGDELCVDAGTGAVWRLEKDTGEWIEDGTSFDRWLSGFVEAEQRLYDDSGEFRDDVFDDAGELMPDAAVARERAVLKRDKNAIAPRWRLARALLRVGKLSEARDELERVVELRPSFGWAWYDLARLAERLGDADAARDDMRAAVEASEGYEHAAFFWAHLARLCEGESREVAAARALELDPDFARSQREAAVASFAGGDADGARELASLAAALAPRDLAVIDLLAKLGE